jgi:predicted ATPase/DNA-binding SARP family transcriptional activator
VPRLEIHLLGPPRVLASGRVLPIRRRKALGLMAFLGSSRASHTRELLASTFWPDADPESALGQIRNHLWVLRKAGLDPWLVSEGDMVELRDGKDLWIDVREHRRLLALAGLVAGRTKAILPKSEPILAEAIAIYQQPFLAGFHLADSLSFDEWQLREEDALRTDQGSALDALTHLREKRGDLSGAVESARRRAELDPLDESSLRTLMTLYLRMGRREEALRCYERTSGLLKRDLQIAPARETDVLRNRIMAAGPADSRSEAAAASTHRVVLPEPPTPFVGREGEIREITRYLDKPGLRLLTLAGPGGCGKTRLALEAGRRLSDRFPDGVVFASLSSIEAGYLLPAALAEVLPLPRGARDRVASADGAASSGSFEELIDFLREKRVLIILDNLEQIAGDLGPLRTILARTRRPVFLATSRSRLRIAGEQIMDVDGLPWPGRKTPPADLPRYDAVRLFFQSVRRTRAPFTASAADLAAAAEICRRLRGHPLGIELAASWAHCMSIGEIARQVASGLDLEAAPKADVPARHRSLRAVFEQSWAFFSRDERAAFRRLSHSPGSFDREAALEIGRVAPEVFASLIEQSILRRVGDRRFEILETLRQFGRMKLAENAREEALVLDRAARHYLGKLAGARSSLEGTGQKRTLHHLTRERHNLRQAWLRASERWWVGEMSKALRPLFLFYDMTGREAEGVEAFGIAAERLTRAKPLTRAGSLSEQRVAGFSRAARGWFIRFESPEHGRRLARRGQRELQKTGTIEERALVDALVAILHPVSTQVERRLRDDALQCEKAGDLWCAGLCWEILAGSLSKSDPAEGFRLIHRSLDLRRRCRDQWSVALGLYALGDLLEARGLLRGARRRYEESLTLRNRLGVDPDGIFSCLDAIARVALRTGALEDARRYGAEALAVAQRRGNRERIGRAQTHLAEAHLLSGSPAEARPLLESALTVAGERESATWSSELQALSGVVLLELGEIEEARWCLERARSFLSTDARPESPPTPGQTVDGRQTSWCNVLEARLARARRD